MTPAIQQLLSHTLLAHCTFERTATTNTLIFDGVLIVGTIASLILLSRLVDKAWLRFLITAAGVAIFEMFTGPMWVNEHLGKWAYFYTDCSWILTIGWTALILGTVVLVDRYLSGWSEPKRFAAYLVILLGPILAAEIVTVQIGIRRYSPEVKKVISGTEIAGVPIEILYYVPVFTALVIAFYKYWSFYIDGDPLLPMKKRKWARAIGLAFVAVFMFELLIEPMVENNKFPTWSYIYRDISLVMTLAWVLMIAVAAIVVGRLLLRLTLPQRYIAGIFIISALALPVEAWLINNGYREYGHSAVSNFTGYKTYLTGVPVEIAFAIPCYLALIVAFIRYWEIVLDNRL